MPVETVVGDPADVKLRHVCRRCRLAILAASSLLLAMVLLATVGGCAQMTEFRITNATGKEVTITSLHTRMSVHVLPGKTADVPHTAGDIIVSLLDGKRWIYRNLAPLDLRGTPFMAEKHYLLFGWQDGHIFRGLWRVDLLLDRDGRLYAVPRDHPDANVRKGPDANVRKGKQPKGFPVRPEGARETKTRRNAAPAE